MKVGVPFNKINRNLFLIFPIILIQTDNDPNESRPKRTKSLPIIYDGHFFEVKEQIGNTIKAICKICGNVRNGYENATGNLTKHFKEKHHEKYDDLMAYISKKVVDVGKPNMKQSTIPLAHLLPSEELNKLIMNFIVSESLSFSTIRKASFRKLLEGVSGRKIKLPAPKTFDSLLRNETDILNENLKDLLSKQEYVCETIDAWSSRASSYVGITVHFLDEITLERKSYVLAFREVKFKQTHINLAKFIHEVNKEFGLSPSKVRYAVTDGGSAFVKAFEKYGNNHDSEITYINADDDPNDDGNGGFIVIDDEDFVEEQQTINDNNDYQSGDEQVDDNEPALVVDNVFAEVIDLNQIQNAARTEPNDSSDFFNDREEIKLPKQFRCTAHNLNLVAGVDFMKNLEKSVAKSFRKMFSKLYILWGMVKRRSQAKHFCKEICGCILLTPNATRWNSRFDAARRVLELKTKVIDLHRNILDSI